LATECNKNKEQHDAKLMPSSRTNGTKRFASPLRRLSDEAETGILRSILWRMMMVDLKCLHRLQGWVSHMKTAGQQTVN